MSLKILITNDDGIDAVGLEYLVEHAKKYGDITVVAPMYEQSAKSQAIEVRKSFVCKKIDKFKDVDTYVVDSTPTDCIRFAKYGLHLNYDLVLSGINRGYNVGEDIWYSGTVSVTYEAVSTKAKAIAFSVIKSSTEGYKFFDEVMEFILSNNLLDDCDIYNVNMPNKSKGIYITRQGGCNFDTEFVNDGEDCYLQTGSWIAEDSIDKLYIDSACVANGYISITPLTIDRTDMTAFNQIIKKHLK